MPLQLNAAPHLTTSAGNEGTTVSPKLAKSAREFEAILLQSWLEKMNQSFAGLEESQDPAHDTLSSLGTQAIAGALAARGSIGIAKMIVRQLERRPSADSETASAPERQKAAPALSTITPPGASGGIGARTLPEH